MNQRRTFLSAIAALALGLASLIGATSVQAATVIPITDADCSSSAPGSPITASPGDVLDFTANLTGCAGASVGLNLVASSASIDAVYNPVGTNINTGGAAYTVSGGVGATFTRFRVTLGSTIGTEQITFSDGLGNPRTEWNVTISSGGGSGGSSTSTAAAPQTVEISLTPGDGTTCRNSSQPGTAGTWISLPGADDCTPPASKAGATLLGWATSPNFPVAIAKRQVDNGWGAYETFNDDGQLTGVFIPAGGATFLSGSGKLYTIWSE
jgi:hypothetical protein